MLEISLRHDDREIQLLRVSDDIDTDAVVNLIRAALESHKMSLAASQANTGATKALQERVRKHLAKADEMLNVKLTRNAQAVLAALLEFGEPLGEARALDPLLQRDPRYRGSSVETIRLYLRQFETAGWMVKTPDGKRQLTPQGREVAERYRVADNLGEHPESPNYAQSQGESDNSEPLF